MKRLLITNELMLSRLESLSFDILGKVLYDEEFADTLAAEMASQIVEEDAGVEYEPVVTDNYWNE